MFRKSERSGTNALGDPHDGLDAHSSPTEVQDSWGRNRVAEPGKARHRCRTHAGINPRRHRPAAKERAHHAAPLRTAKTTPKTQKGP
ncbi:hypothetical protein GCM10010106_50400 [Thermopolyspora flexuosa]|nr:hypothetical protein GCM10010106_50400 [Thermopolyspora flexuosa]